MEVTALDLSRLDPDEFLNDTCIDFYLRCGPGCPAHMWRGLG